MESIGDQVLPSHPNHNIMMENTKILSVEHKWCERGLKEAIHIQALNPSMNRDGGHYNFPLIWNNIIKERLTENGAGTTNGGGPGPGNSVSVPASLQHHLEIASH